MKRIEVAVGVVMRGSKVFICKRPDNLHQGGKWEFPGGKKEADESMAEALSRELLEEIGIQVISQQALMVIKHDYPDKQVCLDIRVVNEFDGEPHGKEGQQSLWVDVSQLTDYEFPEANKAIVERLQAVY